MWRVSEISTPSIVLLKTVIGISCVATQIDKTPTFDDPLTPSSAWDDSALSQDETVDAVPRATANHTAQLIEVKLSPSPSSDIKNHTVGSNGIGEAARKRRMKSA